MIQNFQNILHNKKAISMPEIMASITIITILASTGVASSVNRINQAKIATTMNEMQTISGALIEYQEDNPGKTISTITTLVTQNYLVEGFTKTPDSDLQTNWKEDAWGNAYVLTPPYIDSDGDYMRGSLESPGPDGILTDNANTTNNNESDDNIKITLEPMFAGN